MQNASQQRHRAWRLHGIVFTLALGAVVALAGWLSTRWTVQADWTAGARNTLSAQSRTLLSRIEGPVQATVFARRSRMLRAPIAQLLDRYHRVKPDFRIRFVDPDRAPGEVRRLGITHNGEIELRYGARSLLVRIPSEQAITSALMRLSRNARRWVVFLTGHGERDLLGHRNYDLGNFAKRLRAQGLRIEPLELARAGQVPRNTAVLVLSAPQVDLLPGEARAIIAFLAHGGNVLWLGDPGPLHGLAPVARWLGVRFAPGVIADPQTHLFGIGDPSFVITTRYPHNPALGSFALASLFPRVAAISTAARHGFSDAPLLEAPAGSWVAPSVSEDHNPPPARARKHRPLVFGATLTRARPATDGGGQQRIAVIGDGDFLSNAYLGNGGNLQLGLNLVNWLSGDDRLVDIPVREAPDTRLTLTRTEVLILAFGSLAGLPLLLLGTGATIYWRRRRR